MKAGEDVRRRICDAADIGPPEAPLPIEGVLVARVWAMVEVLAELADKVAKLDDDMNASADATVHLLNQAEARIKALERAVEHLKERTVERPVWSGEGPPP